MQRGEKRVLSVLSKGPAQASFPASLGISQGDLVSTGSEGNNEVEEQEVETQKNVISSQIRSGPGKVQGNLAHKKPTPSSGHHRALGIGLL